MMYGSFPLAATARNGRSILMYFMYHGHCHCPSRGRHSAKAKIPIGRLRQQRLSVTTVCLTAQWCMTGEARHQQKTWYMMRKQALLLSAGQITNITSRYIQPAIRHTGRTVAWDRLIKISVRYTAVLIFTAGR